MSMDTLPTSSVELQILTFKEGLLSRVAHDLMLRVDTLTVTGDPESGAVEASIDPRSLRVICAMKRGREDHKALKDKDKAEIEKNLREDVLEVGRFGEITFSGTTSSDALEGTLTLHGVSRAVRAPLRVEGAWRVAEIELDQRQFDIRPYQAMMGALKVKPAVRARIRMRWP